MESTGEFRKQEGGVGVYLLFFVPATSALRAGPEPRGGEQRIHARLPKRHDLFVQGISDPGRDDLRKLQQPAEKYEAGRVFELAEEGGAVRGEAADWIGRLADGR